MSVIDEILEYKYVIASAVFRTVDYFYIPKSKALLDQS